MARVASGVESVEKKADLNSDERGEVVLTSLPSNSPFLTSTLVEHYRSGGSAPFVCASTLWSAAARRRFDMSLAGATVF